jgi:Starch binding domain
VTFTVPSVSNGVYNVQLKTAGNVAGNTIQFTVLTAKLIPITFTVNNAKPTNTSVPAGTTIQFKFIKIAANGAVTWENGANHAYTVPTSGDGYVNVNWQY